MPESRNIVLVIEYDGTGYHGWQTQKNALSVQSVIEDALLKLTGEKTRLTASGRTDTGVHALGQVANFQTKSTIPGDKYSHALNSILPGDIAIRLSSETAKDFHSRFSAKGKRYLYRIYNSPVRSAILRNTACHVPQKLDVLLMNEAASYFRGTHDFSAFRSAGGNSTNPIRTISDAMVAENGEGLIEIDIAGDGFLYNMVRIIAGTLIMVGDGRKKPGEIESIIAAGDRRKAGKTAPPHGLYLKEVYYDCTGSEEPDGKGCTKTLTTCLNSDDTLK
ncbi:MAG: tRNA pseudouridine(38-40) synthase TruA [Eubacteriales bacterium]|nr:tRNA pseudouridine(38-40) synthase TruA [Eubacteriales bacterium]